MKMSSRRAGLKHGSVAQHRPQNVDPPAGERDWGSGMPLDRVVRRLASPRSRRRSRGAELAAHGLLIISSSPPMLERQPYCNRTATGLVRTGTQWTKR